MRPGADSGSPRYGATHAGAAPHDGPGRRVLHDPDRRLAGDPRRVPGRSACARAVRSGLHGH